MRVTVQVLGSGTSSGVPTVGCSCKVCTSTDPRDNRLRPSILVQYENRNVVVDTTPDFRQQVLRARIARLDAVLYTHGHADHILGLDDLRPFNFMQRERIPIYATVETMEIIRRCFSYIFFEGETQSSRPQIDVNLFDSDPISLFGLDFVPVRLNHGRGTTHGFRFGNIAYLTDHSDIPAESIPLLKNLDVLFLDALRLKPHPTHTTLDRAVEWVEQLQPRRAFLTHMSHDLGHARTEEKLPERVRLAYDALEIVSEA